MIKIYVTDSEAIQGIKEKFSTWITKRGGVQVWENVSLSHAGSPDIYTPALTENGEQYPAPNWRVMRGEIISDLNTFEFPLLHEVYRFKVYLRRSSNGLMLKLTDRSSDKLHRMLDKYNTTLFYFDYETKEVVIFKEVTNNGNE